MILSVAAGKQPYDVVIEGGCLSRAAELLNLNRKVLIVTDSGVPAQYANTLAAQCKKPYILTFPQGEKSKTVETWMSLLDRMTEENFTRSDCVVAVGGGVVGDMAGFAASAFLRGIDFYNIPTTLLSQLDSSVGGKVGIDYRGYKNMVGAFYQPKKVLIDPHVLATLESRQIAAGAAEGVKVALTGDKELFSLFESGKALQETETMIYRALAVKARVVAEDETEQGLRRVLNFGHTVGHGVESACGFTLLHGECVALGMLPMVSPAVRERLIPVLKSLNLPLRYEGDLSAVLQAMTHDKKCAGDNITVVRCEEVGSFVFQTMPITQLIDEMRKVLL